MFRLFSWERIPVGLLYIALGLVFGLSLFVFFGVICVITGFMSVVWQGISKQKGGEQTWDSLSG